MKLWGYTYTRYHYVRHPIMFLEETFRLLRYAWQRVFRGWDDRVLWAIDSHLNQYMPIWLREFAKVTKSIPFLDEPGSPMGHMVARDEDENIGDEEERWQEYLKIMAEGFECARLLEENELPIYNEAHAILEKEDNDFLSSVDRFSEIVDELGGQERVKSERHDLQVHFDNGFRYFKKYYFDLWS